MLCKSREAVNDIISDFEYQSIHESQQETRIPEMEEIDVILNENTTSVTAGSIKIRHLLNIPKHKSFYNEVLKIQSGMESEDSDMNSMPVVKIWEAERNYTTTLASYLGKRRRSRALLRIYIKSLTK